MDNNSKLQKRLTEGGEAVLGDAHEDGSTQTTEELRLTMTWKREYVPVGLVQRVEWIHVPEQTQHGPRVEGR